MGLKDSSQDAACIIVSQWQVSVFLPSRPCSFTMFSRMPVTCIYTSEFVAIWLYHWLNHSFHLQTYVFIFGIFQVVRIQCVRSIGPMWYAGFYYLNVTFVSYIRFKLSQCKAFNTFIRKVVNSGMCLFFYVNIS